jgi:2-keto-4-pentenoate hydratase
VLVLMLIQLVRLMRVNLETVDLLCLTWVGFMAAAEVEVLGSLINLEVAESEEDMVGTAVFTAQAVVQRIVVEVVEEAVLLDKMVHREGRESSFLEFLQISSQHLEQLQLTKV